MNGNMQESGIIPSNSVIPFKAQIAGHGSENDGHRSFLKHQTDGHLLKPFQVPPKGDRETAFYSQIQSAGGNEEIKAEFRRWIPKFYGVIRLEEDDSKYLLLEDLTEGLKRASLMDIKIGSKTYGPDASESKRNQEDKKYKGTKGPLGFSVSGLIVHSIGGGGNDGRMKRYDKNFGRDLKTEEVGKIPLTFCDGKIIPELIAVIVSKMKALAALYEKQTLYHNYASSLLFMYDADVAGRFVREEVDRRGFESSVDVKLIDFAHVFPADGRRDDNFLFGLRNLIKVFENALL